MNKIIIDPPDPVHLSLVEISVETNGISEKFIFDESTKVDLDTSVTMPIVWGNITIKSSKVTNFSILNLQMSALSLSLDSIKVLGEPKMLNPGYPDSTNASFGISRGVSARFDTVVTADPSRNKTNISFSLDKDHRILWLSLDAKIYEQRITSFDDSSGTIQTVADSLFVMSRFKFNY
ncbi:hypothetical protein ACFLSQ_07750 [Bacteroidota bacterium]